MDVERAIEHILEIQARAEVRMDRAEARMDRVEARMDRTGRQIAGIQKLIKTGMRLIVRIERAQNRNDAKFAELAQAQKHTDVKIAELAEQQRRTDVKFEKLIDLLRQRPPNGKVNGRR